MKTKEWNEILLQIDRSQTQELILKLSLMIPQQVVFDKVLEEEETISVILALKIYEIPEMLEWQAQISN